MPRMTTAKRDRARELRREMTPSERILWERLRAHRLAGLHFRRQHVILGYIVDFSCDAARLIVEVDGLVHSTQREADRERDAMLSAEGYRILRISNRDVAVDLSGVLARIREACG